MALSPGDFSYIAALVRDQSGNVLDAQKGYWVESRLRTMAHREGFTTPRDLIARMKTTPEDGLHRRITEGLLNNETSFFRDLRPFETLRMHVLPELMVRRSSERALNIWSSACSSGQEPYSICMTIREYFPILTKWQVRVFASDCSERMLARAQNGRYTQIEINRGLPASYLVKYFDKQGLSWQVKPEVQEMVTFSQINLADTWPVLPKMDVIFMRNALIYFDVDLKRSTLAQAERLLGPGGYLFLGNGETTINLSESFEQLFFDKSYCYRLRSR